MASGASSPLGIAGIIFIIIGIIMAVIGIVLLIVYSTTTIQWFVWVLLVGGILLGIIGGIMLAAALSARPRVEPCCEPIPEPKCYMQRVYEPPPVVQPVYAPAPARTIQTRTEKVGQEMFDPDPQTYVYETPAQPVHVNNVVGNYGPGGTRTVVSGTYVPPSTRTYVTQDILPHPVTSVPTAVPSNVVYR